MLCTEDQIGEHHLVVVFVHENGIERLSFFATSCLHCLQSVVPENVWVICTIVLPTMRKFFRSNVESEDTNYCLKGCRTKVDECTATCKTTNY